jgi:arylsulfatase
VATSSTADGARSTARSIARSTTQGTAIDRPPNILLITIEHLSIRSAGCYGNPMVQTPSLDRLAAQGTAFEHCTMATPLCVPSRTSMFTGRYPSQHGCRDNTALLPPDEVHLPGMLRDAGYACGQFGKNHCFPDTAAAGFEMAIDEKPARTQAREVWRAPWPEPSVPIPPEVLAAQPRRFRWGEYPLPIWSGGSYPVPADIAAPRANVDNALAFIEAHPDQPTFTWLSFSDPHPPYRPPAPYDTLYPLDSLPLPPQRENELASKPAVQQVYYHGGWHHLMDETQMRLARSLFYGALTYVDACLGVLFDALEAQDRLKNTVILIHGDHGDFLGEHGLSRKCAAFYDCLVQVPLITYGLPGFTPGTRSDLQVEGVDFLPTLLAVAGVASPPRINGINQLDVIAGRTAPRDSTYAEVGSRMPLPSGGVRAALRDALDGVSYDTPLAQLPLVESGTFFLSRGRMIRTPEWKYAHYVDDIPELYDLQTDPWELENLAGNPQYAEMEAQLKQRLLERTITAGDPR